MRPNFIEVGPVKSGVAAKKILFCLIVLGLSLFDCRPRSNREIAARLVRETFRLTKKDWVRIVGLSDETDVIKLVKFQINGVPLVSRMVRYYRGWQLEDVCGPSGIWGGKPAAAKFDAAEKNAIAQREILIIASALAGYCRSNGEFAFRDVGFLDPENDVYAALCPNFVINLSTKDPWGYPYWFLFGKSVRGQYGIFAHSDLDFLVFSKGRDGKRENWVFDPKRPEAGLDAVWNPDHDIVCFNGDLIRGTPFSPGKPGRLPDGFSPRGIAEFLIFKTALTDREAGK